MIASDSDRASRMRMNSWRRRHDRRNAKPDAGSMTIVRPPAQLAQLLVNLSRGRIGTAAAREIVATATGSTAIELVFDGETGAVERWTLRTGTRSTADGAADTAISAPAA